MADSKFSKFNFPEPQVSLLEADGVLRLPKAVKEKLNFKRPRKMLMYSLGETLIVTPFVKDRKREDAWIKSLMKARGATLDDLIEETERAGQRLYKKKYNDLDYLAGTWSDEEAKEFEKATENFNKIDKGLWK